MDPEAVKTLFDKYNLPDIPWDLLESGAYTNTELAEKFGDLAELEEWLKHLNQNSSATKRRAMLSLVADIQ
jgi:hypothetical protein